jgi:hypothetical protein
VELPTARLAWAPDYPWGERQETLEAALAGATGWGTTEHARELALSRLAQRASHRSKQARDARSATDSTAAATAN